MQSFRIAGPLAIIAVVMVLTSNAPAQVYEAPLALAQRFNMPLIDLEYGVDWYYVTINGEKTEVMRDHTCLAGTRWCSDPTLSCLYVGGICSYCHSASPAPVPGTPSGPLVTADGFCVQVPPSQDDDCYVLKKLDCGFRYESTCTGTTCTAVPAGTASLGSCEPRTCTPA